MIVILLEQNLIYSAINQKNLFAISEFGLELKIIQHTKNEWEWL